MDGLSTAGWLFIVVFILAGYFLIYGTPAVGALVAGILCGVRMGRVSKRLGVVIGLAVGLPICFGVPFLYHLLGSVWDPAWDSAVLGIGIWAIAGPNMVVGAASSVAVCAVVNALRQGKLKLSKGR